MYESIVFSKQSFAGFSFLVSLFKDAESQTFSFWEGDQGFLFSDDEDVAFSGGKGLSIGILDMNDIERSEMSFDVLDLSDSTDVVSSSDVAEFSRSVLDPAFDLVLLEVVLDGVSFSDFRMREPDSSGVVGDDVGDFVGTNSSGFDFEEFEVGFCVFDLDDDEPAFNVVEQSIVFTSFGHVQNVHHTNWVLSISPDFIIDFESALLVHYG